MCGGKPQHLKRPQQLEHQACGAVADAFLCLKCKDIKLPDRGERGCCQDKFIFWNWQSSQRTLDRRTCRLFLSFNPRSAVKASTVVTFGDEFRESRVSWVESASNNPPSVQLIPELLIPLAWVYPQHCVHSSVNYGWKFSHRQTDAGMSDDLL